MDAESYQLYLKGLYHFDGYVPENLKMASDYFEKATAKDPAYAAAYAGLSEASAARVFRICWRGNNGESSIRCKSGCAA